MKGSQRMRWERTTLPAAGSLLVPISKETSLCSVPQMHHHTTQMPLPKSFPAGQGDLRFVTPSHKMKSFCYFTWWYHCPRASPAGVPSSARRGAHHLQKQTAGQRASSWLLTKPGLKAEAPAGWLRRASLTVPQGGIKT